MKTTYILIFSLFIMSSCSDESLSINDKPSTMRIIYLHHSTGLNIWNGGNYSLISRITNKINTALKRKSNRKAFLPGLFNEYNKLSGKNYQINELIFPQRAPYGWHNYPFDYYNIWVKNAGPELFMEEPTLEMLTKEYQMIIFKHCFPVSNIQPDQDSADIDSDYRSVANYKLQYLALRQKLHLFPDTKFIVWTGAAQVKLSTSEEQAERARDFFKWVLSEWDLPGDNIYIWDFYSLQTEGELYFKEEYANSASDSHPNKDFSVFAAKQLFNRIIDVIESDGSRTSLTGSPK